MRNKKLIWTIFLTCCLLYLTISLEAAINKSPLNSDPAMKFDPTLLTQIVLETEKELKTIQLNFEQRDRSLRAELWKIEKDLVVLKKKQKRKHIQLLKKKICVEEALQANIVESETDALKVRYRKGIDLIKLLYEKILALDHHFTGMQTYQNIILLSNPHTYPEFQKVQDVMQKRLKKGAALSLPPILQTNPYLSATFSIASSLLGSGSSGEKQKDLDEISCILDFTVRMKSDLSVIQHETEYLRTANQNLKEECEKLFRGYTKVIDYFVPIDQCRENDDWEQMYDKLDDLIYALEASSGTNNDQGYGGYPAQGGSDYNNQNSNRSSYNSGYNSGSSYSNNGYSNSQTQSSGYGSSGYSSSGYGSNNSSNSYGNNQSNNYGNSNNNNGQGSNSNKSAPSKRALERARIDLEFSTQRVAEFITSYNNFITQGTQYYQKFDNIVSTYENEDECQGKLPRQFGELKFDIKSTVEKFSNTYNLPEIQGSRMRDLLHGMTER